MNVNSRLTLLVAELAGATFLGAACGDRSPSQSANQKMDADKMTATDKATSEAAADKSAAADKTDAGAQGNVAQGNTNMAANSAQGGTEPAAQGGSDAKSDGAASSQDDAVSAKVKAAIVADPGLSTSQINVATKNSVVSLNGTVDNPMSKERAAQIAQTVSGVRSVDNNLTVKQGSSG